MGLISLEISGNAAVFPGQLPLLLTFQFINTNFHVCIRHFKGQDIFFLSGLQFAILTGDFSCPDIHSRVGHTDLYLGSFVKLVAVRLCRQRFGRIAVRILTADPKCPESFFRLSGLLRFLLLCRFRYPAVFRLFDALCRIFCIQIRLFCICRFFCRFFQPNGHFRLPGLSGTL